MKKTIDILVIEDDPWFADQHVRTLSAAGFRAKHVADGIAAIEALDRALPDAIVLDIFLPGPNAMVLLHEIQSYVDLAKLPVIVCTASTLSIPDKELALYGVTDILDKGTMQPRDVVAAVRRALL